MLKARLSLVIMVVGAMAFAACGDDDDKATPAPAASVAATAQATAPAATATPTAAPLSPFIAALNGLSCTGTWTNTTFNSTGPLTLKGSLAGNAGTIALTIGGNVLGGQGGAINVPFTIKDGQFLVDSSASFLGGVKATVGADGKLSGELTAPPALGPKGKVSFKDFGFANKKLTATVDIDFGDGRPHATSKLDATCQ